MFLYAKETLELLLRGGMPMEPKEWDPAAANESDDDDAAEEILFEISPSLPAT